MDGPWAYEDPEAPPLGGGAYPGRAPTLPAEGLAAAAGAEPAATVVERWNWAKCGTLALETEALDLALRALQRARSELPMATHVPLFAGCSRAASAAMESVSRLGKQAGDAFMTICWGLRGTQSILDRIAHANPPPRVAQGVLTLWMHEAELALRVSKSAGAVPGADAREPPPAPGVTASTVFAEQPALERAVFSAGMHARVRGAPLEVRQVFHGHEGHAGGCARPAQGRGRW